MSKRMISKPLAALGLVVSCAIACSKDEPKKEPLAPAASALEAPKPAEPQALALAVAEDSSRFTFLMDSPLEKIDGDAPKSVSGELFVIPTNLAKSTALVKADLRKLTLYQQKRGDEKGDYSDRKKSDLQNEHAQEWLQVRVGGETTEAIAEANRFAEFKIDALEGLSENDVTKLSGAERKVTGTAVGDFRLHGRKAARRAKVELTFKYQGLELESLAVKTLEPLAITLEEFEVHPRDATGKFVKSLTDAISSNLKGKVQKDAAVSVSFSARTK